MIAKPEDIYSQIKGSLEQSGLFSDEANGNGVGNSWRISPEPYYLTKKEFEFFSQLGHHLLKFYTVWNRFYYDSVKGKLPPWFAEYLDAGKPEELVGLGG